MKQNKVTTILLFSIALIIASCEKSNNDWRLTGALDNPEINKVYLYKVNITREKILMDSTQVEDNTFTFTSNNETDRLQAYYFDYDKSKKGGNFFATKNGDDLHVDINTKESLKSKFSKGVFAEGLNSYLNANQKEVDLLVSFMGIYQKQISEEEMQEEMLGHKKKSDVVAAEKMETLKSMESSELKSYLILEEILTQSVADKNTFENYAAALDDGAKKTPHGLKVLDIVGHFEAYSLNIGASFEDFSSLDQKYEALSDADKNSSYGKEVAESIKTLKQLGYGKTPPEIIAKTVDGEDFKLSSVDGKIVLLDFWASWCGPCRLENPHYKELDDQFKDKGLNIIGYSLDTDKEKWKKAIAKDQITWLNISNLTAPKDDQVCKEYLVDAVPANVIIKNGKIVARNLFGPELDDFLLINL